MQRWEYKVVMVRVLNIGDIVNNRKKEQPLDPDISDWMEHTCPSPHGRGLGFGTDYIGRVAWLEERNCWTTISNCLAELGAAGWELVGSTPSHYYPTDITQEWGWKHPDFEFSFKRPIE